MGFNVGDKVKITQKLTVVPGWNNSWEGPMDKAVGQEGEVIHFDSVKQDVQVRVPGVGVWGYPIPSLELVVSKPPLVTRIQMYDPPAGWRYGFPKQFKPLPGESLAGTLLRDGYPQREIDNGGDRYVRFWEQAVLAAQVPSVAATKIDHTVTPANQVSLPVARKRVLVLAQGFAVSLAKNNPRKQVTADDVQSMLTNIGYKSTDLGNSAGSIFSKKNFIRVGSQKSTRNHSRLISVWEYIGG